MRTFVLISTLLLMSTSGLSARDRLNQQERDWLRMVEPIITSKERTTFRRRMKTHAERRDFIRLFWAKRDPDLSDNVNPFRREYLARYDYVLTYYNNRRASFRQFTRSTVFLLLGPPDAKRNFVDWSILGPGYRNPFFEYPPELWSYTEPGYDYRRRELKIQFIPINEFGDYAAVTDRITEFWLINLKNDMIEHPDLDEPPVMSLEQDDYQFLAAISDRRQSNGPVLSRGDSEEARADEDEAARELGSVERKQPEEETVSADQVTSRQSGVKPNAETVDVGETVAMEELETPALPEAPAVPEVEETTLDVPATTEQTAPPLPTGRFDTDLGNDMGVSARMAYFKSGSNQHLLIGRIGFPLASLGFQYTENQYRAPFELAYELVGTDGETAASEDIANVIQVPGKRIIDDPERYYSEAFAVIVDSDRYLLRVQVTDINGGRASYLQLPMEVQRTDRENTRLSRVVLMDPDINPDVALFSIKGEPYKLSLTDRYSRGERIYPVVELLNVEDLDGVSYIEIQAYSDDEMVQTWDLYTEEMTITNQRSMLLHPILDSRLMEPGRYRLRFEIELTNGELLVSQTDLELTP